MNRVILITMFAALLLPACQPDQSGDASDAPTRTPLVTGTDFTPPITPTISAQRTDIAEVEDEGALTPTPTPLPPPTVPPTPIPDRSDRDKPPITLPAPLIFQSGHYDPHRIGYADGVTPPKILVSNMTGGGLSVSPDGRQVLYSAEHDLWVMNPHTGETSNLTLTPDHHEFDAIWWPNRNSVITSTCVALDEHSWGNCLLSEVSLDRSQRTLDSNVFIGNYAVTSDGSMIAYTGSAREESTDIDYLWILHSGSSPERLILSDFGLPDFKYVAALSWSPSNQQIGMVVTYPVEQDALSAVERIVVLDLPTRTSRVLYEYMNAGIGGSSESAPVWASSGESMTFVTYEYLQSDNSFDATYSLWFADSVTVRPFIQTTDDVIWGPPAFSPDQQWIAFASGSYAIGFIRVSDGEVFFWDVGYLVDRVAWVAAP